MTAHEAEEAPGRESIRSRWPAGPFGWLAYVYDHRIRRFRRPIDWSALWAYENTNLGTPLFANGGVLILMDDQIKALRRMALGDTDEAVARHTAMSLRTVIKLRRELEVRLGAATVAGLRELTSTYFALKP